MERGEVIAVGEYDIVTWLRRASEKWPNRTAIEFRGERTPYAVLHKTSSAIAKRLELLGVGRGSIVAVMLEDIREVIPAMVGILNRGAAFMLLDPEYPVKRLRPMIVEAPPQVFVVGESHLSKLLESDLDGSVTRCSLLMLGENSHDEHQSLSIQHDTRYLDESKLDLPAAAWAPDDLCYIYFTSGSTGRPKAVAGRYKGLGHFISWEMRTFHVDETCRVSQLTSPVFDPFLRDIFVPLCAGGTVCIPDSAASVQDPKELIAWIDRSEITLIHCVPTIFRAVVNQQLRADHFRKLKHVLIAGEQLFWVDVKKWLDVFGRRVQLVNLYGPTETTLAKFCHLVRDSDGGRSIIPIGKPIEGARAAIVDEEGNPRPPLMAGEIVIRTPFRSLGYYGQPELTSSVFVKSRFSDDPNDLTYMTGDIGRVAEDGTFELIGRKDQQVKVRGVRIELAEIEGLLRSYEGVSDAVVVDKESLNGDKWLCAYIVKGKALECLRLQEFLSEHLPDSMLPAEYIVVRSLPLTWNGKVDRRALRARRDREADRAPYMAPRSPLETRLATIWEEMLGLQRVGIQDNFFAVGGHSLLATQVLARVRELFGVQVSLQVLFDSPTVAGLSLAIAQIQAEQQEPSQVEQNLAEIEQLPEDNVAAILADEELFQQQLRLK